MPRLLHVRFDLNKVVKRGAKAFSELFVERVRTRSEILSY